MYHTTCNDCGIQDETVFENSEGVPLCVDCESDRVQRKMSNYDSRVDSVPSIIDEFIYLAKEIGYDDNEELFFGEEQ